MTFRLALCCVLAVVVSQPIASIAARDQSTRAAVEASALTSFENVESFVESFKVAVRERSCFKVAALTQFPLRVNWSASGSRAGRTRFLFNRAALCRYFPEIFGPATSRAILSQDVRDMPVGSRGLMFGSGLIWLQPRCAVVPTDGVCPSDQYELRFTTANLSTSPK
jgi:hypothetical protein